MPVSVCHQVSTTGHRSPPMLCRYHIHASGLMGSPTVPRSRMEVRSCFLGCSSPQRIHARMAVGAVYTIVALYFSTMSQNRSLSGKSRRALVHHRGSAVGQGAIDDIAMAGDPANVGGTPVDVLLLKVKDPLGGGVDAHHVSPRSVDNAFGLAGGPASVEDKKHVLAVHGLGGTLPGLALY